MVAIDDPVIHLCRVTNDINSDEYSKWLKTLKIGDTVLLQSFCRIGHSVSEYKIEYWVFSLVKIDRHLLRIEPNARGNQTTRFDIETGLAAAGSVFEFQSRIVPIVPMVKKYNLPPTWIALNPIYEPIWWDGYRAVFLLENRRDVAGEQVFKQFRQSVNCPHYSQKSLDGDLVTFFLPQGYPVDCLRINEPGFRFLYHASNGGYWW